MANERDQHPDSQRLLQLAYHILGSPTVRVAAPIFVALCLLDRKVGEMVRQLMSTLLPETAEMWQELFDHAVAQQDTPPAFEWGDADIADTTNAVERFFKGGKND